MCEMHFALWDSHKFLRRSGELKLSSDVFRCQTNKGWQSSLSNWLHLESPTSLRTFPRRSIWKVGDTIPWNVVPDWIKRKTPGEQKHSSLCFLTADSVACHFMLLFKCLPYYVQVYPSPHTVSQTKGGEGERKRRKRWWGGQKKRKNYKLLKKNYKLNFIKINNVCTLKNDYQGTRSNTESEGYINKS